MPTNHVVILPVLLLFNTLYSWIIPLSASGTFKLTLQFTEDYPNKPPCALSLECSIQTVSLLIMFNTYSLLFLIFLLYSLHFGFIKKDRIFFQIGLEEISPSPICGNIIVRASLVLSALFCLLSLLFCVCYRYIQLGYLGLCSPIPVAISNADVLSFWIYLCFSFL